MSAMHTTRASRAAVAIATLATAASGLATAAGVVEAAATASNLTTDNMRAITQSGSCKAPFSCVHLHEVPVPTPSQGECLIRVNTTSVNPSDVDTAEGGGCARGCGADVSGGA